MTDSIVLLTRTMPDQNSDSARSNAIFPTGDLC